jgi:hypothetical protein
MKTLYTFGKTLLFCVVLFSFSSVQAQINCIDTALNFSGNDQYVTLPPNDLTSTNFLSTLTGDYTIECLLNWSGGAAFQRIFDFSFENDTYFLFLTPSGNSNNAPRFAITTTGLGSPQIVDASTPLTQGVFHHIAVTYSQAASLVTLFVDGVNAGSGIVNINASDIYTGSDAHDNSINYIGLSSFAGDPQLNGMIDEFRISNVVRYTGNFTPTVPFSPDANTVSLYHFNEGSGYIAYDTSGNGYNAELGNSTSAASTDPTWVNCQGTMPVSIIDFTGEDLKGLSELNWTTATEINSNYFDIERSADGKTFTTAGTVKAEGNTTTKTDYSFYDENSKQGINYYRLKEVDLNGNYAYSKIIIVNIGESSNSMKIYPTITTGALNVVIPAPSTLIIYNIMGVAVKQVTVNGTSQNIDVSALTVGQYVIKNSASGEAKTFIKQ